MSGQHLVHVRHTTSMCKKALQSCPHRVSDHLFIFILLLLLSTLKRGDEQIKINNWLAGQSSSSFFFFLLLSSCCCSFLNSLIGLQAQHLNAAVEGLRVKQCGMLLAYTTCRHPAVTPGHTRQALLKVPPPPSPPQPPVPQHCYTSMTKTKKINIIICIVKEVL